MNLNSLILLSVTFLSAIPAFAEIPEKLHRQILAKAPQVDANGDGKITIEELEKAFPELPKNYQRVIRGVLPDMERIFIAVSWDYYTDRMTRKEKPQPERIRMIDAAVAKIESHIDILRKRYPSVTFQCIPYGYGAYEIEKRLRTGDLPGIKHRLSPDKVSAAASIYKDKTGHPASILVELSELIWLRAIYGVDLIKDYPDYESEYDLALLKQIATDVMKAHEDEYGVPRSGE